ncbi:MAG: response regulator [Planctomycetota bacterium]|nr:MAG: response regulator [Planctomycetota bacterium]
MSANILLVDDDDELRAFVTQVLKLDNYSVSEAVNGREALKILASQKIDLVITDILMPEMEGIELVQNIKKEYSQIKMIGMTGGGKLGDAENVERMTKLFFSSFLKKPFDAEDLLKIIRPLLESDS